MSSISPVSSAAATEVFITKEIVSNIFLLLFQEEGSFLSNHSLCLVNKKWHEINRDFWTETCKEKGITLPFDKNRSFQAFCYQSTALFLEQVRVCPRPVITTYPVTDLKLTFSEEIEFVQDRYLIAYQHDKGYGCKVFDFQKNRIVKTVDPDAAIDSVCTSQEKIYIALGSRFMHSYSLDPKSTAPFKVLSGHSEEEAQYDNKPNWIQLVASDQWVVSWSLQTIKQWNTKEDCCVVSVSIERLPLENNTIRDLRIDQNRLYIMASSHLLQPGALFVAKLNRCNLVFSKYIEQIGQTIDIRNGHYASLSMTNITRYEDGLHQEKAKIQQIPSDSLESKKNYEFWTAPISLPNLIHTHALAIFVHSTKQLGINQLFEKKMVELFDVENMKSLFTIQEHAIHQTARWSITIFQGALFYLTRESEVVRITFPSREEVMEVELPQ